MNEGKDDGVGESEALSAHPREAKARTGYGFPQRTDERSARSFIGLCVMRLPFAQAVNLPKLVCFFLQLFLSNKEKVESYKQELIGATVGKPSMESASK